MFKIHTSYWFAHLMPLIRAMGKLHVFKFQVLQRFQKDIPPSTVKTTTMLLDSKPK